MARGRSRKPYAQQYYDNYEQQYEQQYGVQQDQTGYGQQAQKLCVQATFDFPDAEAGQLSFVVGDVIQVTMMREADGWWEGSLRGQLGWFPSNFCSEPYYTELAADAYYNAQTANTVTGPRPTSRPKPPEHDVFDPRSATQSYQQWYERRDH